MINSVRPDRSSHISGSINSSTNSHIPTNAYTRQVGDVHINAAWEIDGGIATNAAAVFRADKCSAIATDVVVVPILRQSKSSEVFFLPFTAAENVTQLKRALLVRY